MLSLDHPAVAHHLAAFRAKADDAYPAMFLDLLEESTGAGLPDLCWLLARCEREDVRAIQLALAEHDGRHRQGVRAREVRCSGENVSLFQKTVCTDIVVQRVLGQVASEVVIRGGGEVRLDAMHPAVREANERALGVICRDLKRRILALYPEVEVVLNHFISEREFLDAGETSLDRERFIRRRLKEAGFHVSLPFHIFNDRRNRRHQCWQTVKAPELVPSEDPRKTAAPRAAMR